jgi:hypothetical protein
MPYKLTIPPTVISRLRGKIRPELLDCVAFHLQRLASDPQQFGRPAVCPPHPPIGHVFHFHCDHETKRYHFTVFFVYGPGVREISVTDISVLPT